MNHNNKGTNMALQIELAKKLRRFREKKGLTQEQAAKESDIPLGTYIQAETNSSMGAATMRKVLNWMHNGRGR